MTRIREGRVDTFDDPAGFGEVADGAGRRWWFHCTAIADGTRTIAEGTAVCFGVVPGRLGRWEAANLVSVRSDQQTELTRDG